MNTNFKIMWQNIWKNKGSSALSILGLAIGIACFMLLGMYILTELRFDRFHKFSDRLALVTVGYKSPDDAEMRYMGVTPTALAPALSAQFPEIEEAVRIYPASSVTVRQDDQLYNEDAFVYADSAFFDVLTYSFRSGDPRQALARPHSVVLTEAMAEKYFKGDNPVGKTIFLNKTAWQVTGVVETPPANTELPFSAVLSYTTLERSRNLAWNSANDITIMRLKDRESFATLQPQVDALIEQQFAEAIQAGGDYQVNIEKLADVHLHSRAAGTGNITYLYILGGFAVGLLLIACINFTNLLTARSTERAREIGVKKVLGAQRGLLIRQFLMESAFSVFIAILLGLILAIVTLPFFNRYVELNISMQYFNDFRFYIGIALLFIVVSVIAGGWPALILSAFKPISVLKGKITNTRGGGKIRQGLVVFQFSISILFIICTFIAGKQLRYMQTTDTGLNRSQILVINANTLPTQSIQTFKQELLNQSGIRGITASYDSPVNVQGGYTISGVGDQKSDFQLSITAIPVEKDFVDVFDIQLLAGTSFTDTDILRANLPDFEQREYTFIVNELTAQTMGWTADEAVGKRIDMNGRQGRIIAVTDDFNFTSLHEKIEPIVLFPEYNYFGKLFIKTENDTPLTSTMADIENTWKSINPDLPFEYHFLDQEYDALFRQETQTARVLNIFSMITLIVAAMGLFGLTAFTAQQRIKEIGIRKVLGASVSGIMSMLSANFLKLVLIAAVIATPIGWWLMETWLEDFAFRIEIQWWMFIFAGTLAVLIALATVSWHAFAAANANPVDSLRDE